MEWHWKKYIDLTLNELYSIMVLRQSIFVVEQNCAYLDADGIDATALHLMAIKDCILIAYLRVLPPNARFNERSIGRVVVSSKYRGTGLGKELTQVALTHNKKDFGAVPIRISAQRYLKRFYEGFGFSVDGVEYLEDGIPHIEMYLDSVK